MKHLFIVLLGCILVTAATAQETFNGPNAEKRNVGAFHGINVGTGIQLVITEGANEELAVSASTTEFRDKIVTKVEDGILKIYYENKLKAHNTRKETKDLKAWVSYKTLDQLEAHTGSVVRIEGILKSGSLKINAHTGARLSGAINTASLEVDQNTGSKMTLTGEAGTVKIGGSTGSRFEGEDLRANTCDAHVSTGAAVTIHAEKELTVKASTGGNIRYKGDAGIRGLKKSTGGKITKI
jgi:hypothetical protein